jgi:hypothetical protein
MSSDEERWHVRIAPGEVKVLTLEQIDDLFRLDMIDEDTLLRQDGTEQWLPLRVVAGLDEEEVAPPAPPPVVRSAPPPPVVRSAPPPPVVRSAPPPPVVRSAPPPPPAPLPPPPSERAPFAPSPSFVPPPPVSARAANAPPPSFAPPAQSFAPKAPSFASPASVPAPVSFAPPLPPPRASRAEQLLIGLAALLGLLVVLHRNGALLAVLTSAGQAAAYDGLEATLGGPGFGTPRAVDALVAKTPTRAPTASPPSAKR